MGWAGPLLVSVYPWTSANKTFECFVWQTPLFHITATVQLWRDCATAVMQKGWGWGTGLASTVFHVTTTVVVEKGRGGACD